ncbi:MAG: hypothetical protein LLG03_14000 [Planctomycetaceae bacterium]|nr:hypothetical protein [Planctomycetaceae bacterium]
MDQTSRHISADSALCLKSEGLTGRFRFAGVRRRGERRRNFLRRWLWRGADELRRQQAAANAPQIGATLDESF